MRKYIIIVLLILLPIATIAQNKDSIRLNEIEALLQKEKSNIKDLKRTLYKQIKDIKTHKTVIDTLKVRVSKNKSFIKKNNNLYKEQINKLKLSIQENKNRLATKAQIDDINFRTYMGISFIIVFLIISLFISILLYRIIKKRNNDITSLKAKIAKINENIIKKLSQEVNTIKSTSELQTTVNQPKKNKEDHSLIIALADRITFMEMTLYKMDSKIRGYKQLHKSISQIKDNLLANNYEIVEMLGKPYNDGMKAIANFIDDEEIEQNSRIITGIIKPQINYQGKMIQSAQITVSENI